MIPKPMIDTADDIADQASTTSTQPISVAPHHSQMFVQSVAAATANQRSSTLKRAAYVPAQFEDRSVLICGTCGTATCCSSSTTSTDHTVFIATAASIDQHQT